MTKADLINQVAKSAGITKKAATVAVNTFIDSIVKALKKGKRVPIAGFGTFSVRKTKKRKGRNPRTGETIEIPAKKRPVFRPGKMLRDAVR